LIAIAPLAWQTSRSSRRKLPRSARSGARRRRARAHAQTIRRRGPRVRGGPAAAMRAASHAASGRALRMASSKYAASVRGQALLAGQGARRAAGMHAALVVDLDEESTESFQRRHRFHRSACGGRRYAARWRLPGAMERPRRDVLVLRVLGSFTMQDAGRRSFRRLLPERAGSARTRENGGRRLSSLRKIVYRISFSPADCEQR
jgi:hypothetical protein